MANAIITGGSRGLGQALARRLAADGWGVVIDGRDAEALADAAAGLGPGPVEAVAGDVTDARHRQALVDAAGRLGRFGGLDLLVNNASTLGPTPLPRLADLAPADLGEILTVNVLAPLALVQLALPLLERSKGTIVNVSSDAAVEGYEGWGGYGASKAALEQLSRVLAVEHPGLRVLWVDPGDMRTQMHQDAFPGEDISDRPWPDESVPGLLELVTGPHASGRYRARDVG
jgi:NAD(P)-dependent dehydrogenase (short-subunit alcohol dehydrogenase family)